ncbi:AMP-binding, conserved site,AMP-binding enzyme, C-terminal domain,AMP-dependent synthetase/ligase [Cinara cedri]|uniref:Medium-chain acyl-CoA ligase ACSF2, mitochondrial n=1 Tax=Cinara cedri TaxID=506608 RepID=A0A5E4NBJ8_9HEMI|nr:AMP-binding, conserved site,AMP-binding enzyme, C-terminal domain,AMP-dependent synthetase/ligase [Cinara cedri]
MNYLFKTRKLYGLHIFSSQFQVYSHWSKHSYLYGASSDPLRPHTVGKIFNDSVQQNPDRDFLISRHENIRCTYATMESEVDKVCKSFNAIELKRGDRLGIWLPNCALYFSLMYAAARLGIISVTINPAYQSDELKHSLTLSGVKCLVTMETFKTQNYPAIIEKIDPEILKRSPNTSIKSKVLPLLKTVVFYSENRINGAYNLKSFLDLGSNKSYVVPDVQPDDGCNIQFTSGTTGKPKAVLLSHFNLVNNIYFIVKRLELFDSDVLHTICCPTPLFHIFGISAGMLASILTKSTIYLPSAHYDPKTTADVITKEKCTFFFGTPTMYVDILSIFEKLQPEQRKDDMRLTIVGGAPCSPKLIHNFKKIFPGAKLMSVFGMTETSPCTFQNMPNDTDEQIMSTVGRIHDHVEAKVVDLNGEMVPFGTPGELLIRGYVNMIGYYNDEEKTKETIDSTKWLKTGDQFMLYENGYGNVVGRTKDMIIRGGENIFPVEIELFLESHPLISNVYGIPDERMGEEVCASVILKEGAMFTEDEIRKYSKGKIAHFKIPKYIFIEQSEFPKTASGKVQKIKLKELAVQRLVKNENMN